MATSYRPDPIIAWEQGIRGVHEQCRETGKEQERGTHLPQQHPQFPLWSWTSCSAGNCSGAFSAAGCPAKTNNCHEASTTRATTRAEGGRAPMGCSGEGTAWEAGAAQRDHGAHPLAVLVPLHQHLLQRPQHLDAQLLLRLHEVLGVLHQPGTAESSSHRRDGQGGP